MIEIMMSCSQHHLSEAKKRRRKGEWNFAEISKRRREFREAFHRRNFLREVMQK